MDTESTWILTRLQANGNPCWFNTITNAVIQCHPDTLLSSDKLAVIVPFRDLHADQKRLQQLKRFIPAMTEFLNGGSVPYKIYIIEQSNDGRKFNRGKLLNVGFVLALQDQCTIFVFHDVDLLPSSNLLPFYITRPSLEPLHIAKLWNRYNKNPFYFGGIEVFSKDLYESLNGYPNNYWGWGGEDDELRKRIDAVGMKISSQPTVGTIHDMEEMSLDQKLKVLNAKPEVKCGKKTELLKECASTWTLNGLSNFMESEQFKILKTESLTPFALKISVELSYNGHWSDQNCLEKSL